ncbi:MAG: hypothetical protein GX043_09025 [Desulfovibrionales bacterium]|nr:hypothetical protein [Desulfovibrionales bacterium]
MPRNRELICVFRDLELVEHLGSGMARFLRAYDKSIFYFSEHFMEVRFPHEGTGSTFGLTPQVDTLIKVLSRFAELSTVEIVKKLNLKDRNHVRNAYHDGLRTRSYRIYLSRKTPQSPAKIPSKYNDCLVAKWPVRICDSPLSKNILKPAIIEICKRLQAQNKTKKHCGYEVPSSIITSNKSSRTQLRDPKIPCS